MNNKTYYLSIESICLAHYISKALILPSRFYKNKPSDIQTIESDYLVLSKDKFLNRSNCSIELVLNEEEIKYLKKNENENIFFYTYPIAISRIKKIFFMDEAQKIKTIDNIQRGVGFIYEKLIEISNDSDVKINIEIDSYKYPYELEENIKTYNQVLGGVAFVRHKLKGEYAENYFSILSHFNDVIKKYFENSEYKINYKYNGAFSGEGSFWGEIHQFLYGDITDQELLNFAKKEEINIERRNGLWQYEEIENKKSIIYKLAILSIYGEDSSKRKKTNDLISDCKNGKIPRDKQEGIALIYGINNGYSAFRNEYEKKIVKFKMDSLLDYYTVEAIFQYTVNNKKHNEKFEYIDTIFPNEKLTFNKVIMTTNN